MNGRAPAAPRHPWALGIGIALLLPEIVLAVVVGAPPILVGLAGFLMTAGFVRLASLGSLVLRERRGTGRGALLLTGAVATVAGALLYAQVARAAQALGDEGYGAAVAPPGAIALNLVVILTLGLWIGGVVLVIAALLGLVADRRAGVPRS